jgi:hypothetical protein
MSNPEMMTPNSGNYDRNQLAPLYEKVFAKYKKHNPDTIMYFETGQFPDSYWGNVFAAGFDKPPGGEINSPNHVLNDHSYCCQLGGGICDSGEPDPNKS